MSLDWDGNLLNTPTDVLIDGVILLLCACTCVPQILRLRTQYSGRGLSAYYVLSNSILNSAQLSWALLCAAYAWPDGRNPVLKQINDGSLTGLRALGGIMGHLQLTIQWLGSFAVLLAYRSESRRTTRAIQTIGVLFTLLFLYPAIAGIIPTIRDHTFEWDFGIALLGFTLLAVTPCVGILQLFAQFQELVDQRGSPGDMSLLSLGLQALSCAAVGFRWFLRLGKWSSDPDLAPPPISLLYEWAFTAANEVITAVVCALLLVCYGLFRAFGRERSTSEERLPLIR